VKRASSRHHDGFTSAIRSWAFRDIATTFRGESRVTSQDIIREVGPDPAIRTAFARPTGRLAGRHPILVALVNRAEPRFFEVGSLGTVELSWPTAVNPRRGKSPAGRTERDRSYIFVAEHLEELLRERPGRRIILAGRHDETGRLRWFLPDPVAERLVGTVTLDSASATCEDVQAAVLPDVTVRIEEPADPAAG
jgi:hypothetical protein